MTAPTLHPERTDDPRILRWLTGSRQLTGCPSELTALIEHGVLERVEVGTGEVRTWLGLGRSWAQDGPQVRSALFAALSAPADGAALDGDELVARIAEILERDVAPTAASHGGDVTVRSVEDGVLTVEFGGACRGCSARGHTLTELVSTSVRSRLPQIREVRGASARRAWLAMPRRREGA